MTAGNTHCRPHVPHTTQKLSFDSPGCEERLLNGILMDKSKAFGFVASSLVTNEHIPVIP